MVNKKRATVRLRVEEKDTGAKVGCVGRKRPMGMPMSVVDGPGLIASQIGHADRAQGAGSWEALLMMLSRCVCLTDRCRAGSGRVLIVG